MFPRIIQVLNLFAKSRNYFADFLASWHNIFDLFVVTISIVALVASIFYPNLPPLKVHARMWMDG